MTKARLKTRRLMQRAPFSGRVGLLCGFGFLAILALNAHAAIYEVMGQVRTVIYDNRTVTHSRTNPFKASVNGCDFRVRTEATGLGILYSEFAVAGDYSFDSSRNDVALMNSAPSVDEWGFEYLSQPKRQSVPEAILCVNATVVPPYSTATLPWLAYGSRCFLSGVHTGVIISPVVQDFANSRTKYWLAPKAPAQWRFSSRPPGLLESLVVFRDGAALGLPAPFSNWTTNCVYEVLQWTNVAGLALPLEFKLTRYAIDPKAKRSPRLLLDAVVHGLAQKVSPRLSIEGFLLPITTNTMVFDRRFEDEYSENAIFYMAEKGRILNYDELKSQPRFKAFMRQ